MLQASERPNIYCETLGPDQFGIIEKPLTLAEQIYNKVWLRKVAILVVLALAWEIYGRWLDNPLLVPPFSAAVRALITDVANGIIPSRALSSIEVLLVGFAIGTVLAGLLTVFAISSKIGTDFLDTMTAMFNPLPAIALLPLALIWFGLGNGSLIFVLVHSVMWAVSLNMLAGFRGVSTTARMVGRNYNLRGLRFVGQILIPAAFPSILAGPQDRLGLCLAHADRGRTRVRRLVGSGRAWLVHLREQEPARYSGSVRRPADHHPHWACGRERGVSPDRSPDRSALGHADVMTPARSQKTLMLHRRNFCKALAAAPVALASPMLMRSSFADEVSSIVIVSQHGLPYLPLMVMDALQLVQKHAGQLGIAAIKPEYKSLGGTQSLIDALLSRQMDFGVTGVPSLATLWDKTAGTPNEVRALSAVQSMPFMLVTNKPSIKSIKDFTEQDKIAVPAIKVSSQAICLQMAAAKEWGDDQYAKLDAYTITRSHPDAARLDHGENRNRQPLLGRALLLLRACNRGRAQRAEIL